MDGYSACGLRRGHGGLPVGFVGYWRPVSQARVESHRVIPTLDLSNAGHLRFRLNRTDDGSAVRAPGWRRSSRPWRCRRRRPPSPSMVDAGFAASLAEGYRRVLAPWSQWWMTSSGRRCPIAISIASSTSSARRWVAIDQPTILRLQRRARPRDRGIPAIVGTYVMSATHSWFGRVALKSRSTRSGAGRSSLFRRVVVGPPCRWLAPTNPAARISRAIRLRSLSSRPTQLGVNARRPVGLPRTGMHRLDPFSKAASADRVRGRWPFQPRV